MSFLLELCRNKKVTHMTFMDQNLNTPKDQLNGTDFIIRVQDTFEHCSTAHSGAKQGSNNGKDIKEVVESILQLDEGNSPGTTWVSNNEIHFDGLSSMALHSLLLKLEKAGKTISYTKTLTVKISD